MDVNDGTLQDTQWLQQIEEYRVETTVNVEPQNLPVRLSPEITSFLEEQGEVRLSNSRRIPSISHRLFFIYNKL